MSQVPLQQMKLQYNNVMVDCGHDCVDSRYGGGLQGTAVARGW